MTTSSPSSSRPSARPAATRTSTSSWSGSTSRPAPAAKAPSLSPTLTRLLHRHATTRGAHHPDNPVFRRQDGTPITARRYSTIFDRARPCLEWSQRTPVSAHVLRHTAINAVARHAGYPVAQTFAGHTPAHVTGRYLQATITEVAATIATLTNEPHPLAPPADRACHHR